MMGGLQNNYVIQFVNAYSISNMCDLVSLWALLKCIQSRHTKLTKKRDVQLVHFPRFALLQHINDLSALAVDKDFV